MTTVEKITITLIVVIAAMTLFSGCRVDVETAVSSGPAKSTNTFAVNAVKTASRFDVLSAEVVWVPHTPNITIYELRDKYGSNDFVLIEGVSGTAMQPISRADDPMCEVTNALPVNSRR